ncbi:hypothetical protein [Phenylobacterium zucineum]|uniref:hypothetical protein n=1 Tax=Phenylobacterium zucineum TaxID=284016 RepID=UPI000308B8DF|nr:hypothetical protein [Phenylobacterium zucineum]
MRTRAGTIAAGLPALIVALIGAAPAAAQPAADPIGALLGEPPSEAADPPKPEILPAVAAPPPIQGVAYDSRIRASMASAQGFQGSLDGGWLLMADGAPLYEFQLVDRGDGALEGAWRDIRRPLAPAASGLVDEAARSGAEVILRFDGARVAVLRAVPGGGWNGELREAGGARRPVSLARRAP